MKDQYYKADLVGMFMELAQIQPSLADLRARRIPSRGKREKRRKYAKRKSTN